MHSIKGSSVTFGLTYGALSLNLYRLNTCQKTSQDFNGLICANMVCTDPNCARCFILVDYCSVCATGFDLI